MPMKITEAKIRPYLNKIKAGEIQCKVAAAELSISVGHLNRLMRANGVKRPAGQRRQEMTETVLRRAAIKGAVEAFMRGIINKHRAADKQIPADTKIDHVDYDWRMNNKSLPDR